MNPQPPDRESTEPAPRRKPRSGDPRKLYGYPDSWVRPPAPPTSATDFERLAKAVEWIGDSMRSEENAIANALYDVFQFPASNGIKINVADALTRIADAVLELADAIRETHEQPDSKQPSALAEQERQP